MRLPARALSKTPWFRVWLMVLGSLALSALAWAQSSGVISGTVTDGDNRPLPGVTVTLSSPDDSSRRSTVTNASGRYEFVNLAAATYTISGELPGFRAAAKTQRVTGSRREVWLLMEAAGLRETIPAPARPPARIVPLSRQR